jgi:hypothetical protein
MPGRKQPYPRVSIDLGDDFIADAFGRLRISQIETLFDSNFEYTVQPTMWRQIVTGGATISHVQLESAMKLQVGTLSGDKATHETKGYHRYQPGKSQLFVGTGIIGTPKTGVESRIGYFDDDNGVFFEQSESGMKVVIRSNTTGTPVDTEVAQGAWNLDKMDGKSTNRVELDPSKIQIFVIDLQWLGAGRVRFGFHMGGEIIYCHEFEHANINNKPYMTTANLPIRYQIENLAASASATEMKHVCAMVASEGGFNAEGLIFSQHTDIDPATISTRVNIISIRPKATFGGINNHVLISPVSWRSFADTNDCVIQLIKGGTLGGAPTWISADPNSAAEYTTDQVTVTGGIKVDSGFVIGGAQVTPGEPALGDDSLLSKFIHGLENGVIQEAFSMVAVPAGNAIVRGALRWKEYQ